MTTRSTSKPTGAAAPRPGAPALSIKGRALKLLAQREHSRVELERKLAPHEQQPGELAAALDALQSRGFINEERVAESVLHRRAARLGSARIRHELKLKGLDDAVVAQTLARLRDTEVERAQSVWRGKFDALPADARERARQARFLASRGFGGDVIARVLRGGFESD
ncbi:MAG: recombination regulator RecX [Betaproteobacteria bacterium]|nr:recombination regulator RecX [Betaproteobacteria bacterium]